MSHAMLEHLCSSCQFSPEKCTGHHKFAADNSTIIECDKYDPMQCDYCSAARKPGEKGKHEREDLDPGDPENGPAPDIQDYWFCDKCAAKHK